MISTMSAARRRLAEIILGCYAVGKEPETLPSDVTRTMRRMGDLLA
jgi:hypothetical protein